MHEPGPRGYQIGCTTMANSDRLQTGIPELDERLGGGLLRGTLTVVMGATGIGKTQLGLQFADHGRMQEGERGILFDVTSRGDSQNHREYARRLFEWNITTRDAAEGLNPEDVRARDVVRRDYLHIFNRSGRRVTRSDMEPDDWKEWRIELAQKLDRTISFFYGNFAHGVRRCVIDGVEPTDNAADSFQLHLFEYVYHQILRKDSEWVARDLFRVRYRANADFASQHAWNCEDVGCVLLHTSHEVMLEELLSRRIESGDLLSNANTIILMGRTREGNRMGRALFVAKHRGSACDDAIVPFDISESGLRLGRSP